MNQFMTKEERIKDLEDNDFDVLTLDQLREQADEDSEDDSLIEDMVQQGCDVLLTSFEMARSWYFSTFDAMTQYFNAGGELDFSNAYCKLA